MSRTPPPKQKAQLTRKKKTKWGAATPSSLADRLEQTASTLQPKSFESKSFWERWTPSWLQTGTEKVADTASRFYGATKQTLAPIAPILRFECEDAKKWISGVEILINKVRQVQTTLQNNASIYQNDDFNQLLSRLNQRLQDYAEVVQQVNNQAIKLQQKGCITVETLLGLQEIEKTVNKIWFAIYNGIGYTIQTAMAENVDRVRVAANVVGSFQVTTQDTSPPVLVSSTTPSSSFVPRNVDAFATVPSSVSSSSSSARTVASLGPSERDIIFAPPGTSSPASTTTTTTTSKQLFGF